jgi:hypothetical protein
MSKNSRATCVAPSTARDVAENSVRLLTKDGLGRTSIKQDAKPTAIQKSAKPGAIPQKRRSLTRTNAFRNLRVTQEYLSGKNQTQIAKEIGINRDTVNKIVRAPEMSAYIESKLEEWRGLCDPALRAARILLNNCDKETMFRVLETNGIIPPKARPLTIISRKILSPRETNELSSLPPRLPKSRWNVRVYLAHRFLSWQKLRTRRELNWISLCAALLTRMKKTKVEFLALGGLPQRIAVV